VVEGELKLHRPNKPNVLAGQILFPFYRIDDILPAYNKWVSSLPDEMAVYGFSATSPTRERRRAGALSLRFTPVFNGSFAEGMSLLQPLFKLQPSSVSLYSMTLPEFEAMAGASTSVSGRGAYIRSALLAPGTMDAKARDVFKRYMSPHADERVVRGVDTRRRTYQPAGSRATRPTGTGTACSCLKSRRSGTRTSRRTRAV